MNVSLTPQLESFVQEKVSSGLYTSASEVIREALRMMEEQDQLKAMRLEALYKEVQKGIDQLDRGEGIPFDPEEIKAEARRRKDLKQKRAA
jgi:antitoxin ParD1/3/4